ncbi:MAG: insulinase family protein [Eubacteriales bacterium]|nr:insulinase family protein [Eubacteriales bacterium]
MEQLEKLYGFTLIEKTHSVETGAEAYVYKHDKTGATLVHLANDEQNKTFGVGFRTPPEDSTGVAHILEHAVLAGSEKFRTKEPFMDLIQGSLQTFLNAMTFADMTIYPVSSKNNQDFRNLVEVYLDAVFFPLVHERPMIFKQEGWHSELADKDSPIIHNGVVFNEMRGAYSSPDAYNNRKIMEKLYPGSTYAHESGGFPWTIAELKYEDFLAFHDRYYHPSNCLFFFYGDCDLKDLAKLIEEDYLSRFEFSEVDSQIEEGQPLTGNHKLELTFNAEPGQEAEGDSYLGYFARFGEATDNKSRFILDLLYKILLESEAAPLRRAILEAGLAEEVESFSTDIFYLTFGVMLKKAKASDADKFAKLVDEVLRKELEKGLDRDLVLASLNAAEMEMRELGGPQRGIILFILTMYAFRYDLEPLAFLSYNQFLEEIRAGIDEGILEKYIQERILDSKAHLITVHKPEAGLYNRFDQEVADRLAKVKAEMSDAEIQELIDETNELLKYQQTPDSPEAKATIPTLKLAELEPELEDIAETETEAYGATFYLHEAKCSGLCYVNLYFPIHHLNLDEIHDLNYMLKLLGYIDCEEMDYAKLSTEIGKVSGGLNTSLAFIENPEKQNERFANIGYVMIGNKHEQLLPLLAQVLGHSKFTAKRRIRELLQQQKLQFEMNLDYSSHMIGLARCFSHLRLTDMLADECNGLGYYFNLSALLADEAKFEAFCDRLEALAKKVFAKTGLRVAITADTEELAGLKSSFEGFIKELPETELEAVEIPFESKPRREAFTTSTGINYIEVAQDYEALGYEYEPSMTVLSSILSSGFLHNQIRAQGGAYGAGNPVRDNGNIGFFTYRDPNPKRSYEIFHKVPEQVEQIELDDADLERLIIGCISRFDPVIVPAMINGLMFTRRLTGRDHAYLVKTLKELIETKLEQLKKHAQMYRDVLAKEALVLIGDEGVVEEHKALFDSIEKLKR